MRLLAGIFCFAAAAQVNAQAPRPTTSAACERLATLSLDRATVTSAEFIAAQTPVPGAQLAPAQVSQLPAFCRVRISDHPSSDSDIRTEVWLPLARWNGRLEGFGNGGFAGEIYYAQMAAAVTQGYATAGTDTGHTGGDATFALGHPEKIVDFGLRAIHDMTLEAKQLAAAFYGAAPAHAYFTACSDGGREALMEAQRFPADYDGILAGAPAYNWTALVAAGAVAARFEALSPANTLPAAKVPVLAAAVRLACDARDGVMDGILNDPRTCGFDPATLLCREGDNAHCLTQPEVDFVKLVYATKYDSKGKEVFPGYLPGAEDAKGGWVGWIVPEKPTETSIGGGFVNGFFGDFVHGTPDWKVKSFDLDRDLALAREKTSSALDATDTNLAPFLARGGKLILYHGWNDPAIPALSTVAYFNGVQARLGTKATDAAVRLYMVPGMLHCAGGPGATDFGQFGAGRRGDAQNDVLTALEQWVEAGHAPDRLTSRSPTTTRPLCPFPQVAVYKGGDPNVAASFTCGAATR